MAATKVAAATPRASSNLNLGFGMVNVPISLKPLAETKKSISGKYICPVHGPHVAQRYLCSEGSKDEHLLEASGQVTAYEHPEKKGEYVVVDPEVLNEIAEERSGQVEVERFVPIASIDPIYFDKSYLAWPQKGGEQAFDLFAEVLRSEEKAAVSTVVLSKQTVTLVIRWSPATETLVAHTCRFQEQVRWSEIGLVHNGAEARPEPSAAHLKAARALIASLDGEFEPGEVVDHYTPLLQEAIRAAASGATFEPVTVVAPEPKEDLLDALMASVAQKPKKARASTRKEKVT